MVESPTIPFRHAPGLGLTATAEPPPQLGVFTDADGMTAITRFDGDWATLRYLDQQTAALPFHLLDDPRTLVLGAGGGADVLLALYHDAAAVDAVELNPQVVDLVADAHADFAGHLYDRPEVAVHVGEARSFVEASPRQWDLIHVALLDSFLAASAGVHALSESPLYTVEALGAYLDHLAPGGMLAVTRWLKVPPRDTIKLLATAITALERRGVDAPGERLVLIRGWNTATLLVRNGAFTTEEIRAVRGFAAERAFDVAWYPGMPSDEANRYNRLAQPYLYEAATALLGPAREAFIEDYKFHIAPATDDAPYFFRSFKWELLPELMALRGQGGLTLLDSGYLILVLTLAQATVASLLLVLLPLVWLRRHAAGPVAVARWRVAVYFLGLGFAFLFVEIAFIQRFTLFLGHPLSAIAVVLCAFLVFAGLGAGVSGRLAERLPRTAFVLPVAAIALFAGGYLIALPAVFPALVAQPLWLKVPLALALVVLVVVAAGLTEYTEAAMGAAARRMASRATSSGTPLISKRIRPGLITAT